MSDGAGPVVTAQEGYTRRGLCRKYSIREYDVTQIEDLGLLRPSLVHSVTGPVWVYSEAAVREAEPVLLRARQRRMERALRREVREARKQAAG